MLGTFNNHQIFVLTDNLPVDSRKFYVVWQDYYCCRSTFMNVAESKYQKGQGEA